MAAPLVTYESPCECRDNHGKQRWAEKNDPAPWSLSRVVLAWWLTICVGCFAYLWALMGEYRNIISGSAPILLGLQRMTLLVATGFGQTKAPCPSQGFFNDLISKGGEPEIARLQMLGLEFHSWHCLHLAIRVPMDYADLRPDIDGVAGN